MVIWGQICSGGQGQGALERIAIQRQAHQALQGLAGCCDQADAALPQHTNGSGMVIWARSVVEGRGRGPESALTFSDRLIRLCRDWLAAATKLMLHIR